MAPATLGLCTVFLFWRALMRTHHSQQRRNKPRKEETTRTVQWCSPAHACYDLLAPCQEAPSQWKCRAGVFSSGDHIYTYRGRKLSRDCDRSTQHKASVPSCPLGGAHGTADGLRDALPAPAQHLPMVLTCTLMGAYLAPPPQTIHNSSSVQGLGRGVGCCSSPHAK